MIDDDGLNVTADAGEVLLGLIFNRRRHPERPRFHRRAEEPALSC